MLLVHQSNCHTGHPFANQAHQVDQRCPNSCAAGHGHRICVFVSIYLHLIPGALFELKQRQHANCILESRISCEFTSKCTGGHMFFCRHRKCININIYIYIYICFFKMYLKISIYIYISISIYLSLSLSYIYIYTYMCVRALSFSIWPTPFAITSPAHTPTSSPSQLSAQFLAMSCRRAAVSVSKKKSSTLHSGSVFLRCTVIAL